MHPEFFSEFQLRIALIHEYTSNQGKETKEIENPCSMIATFCLVLYSVLNLLSYYWPWCHLQCSNCIFFFQERTELANKQLLEQRSLKEQLEVRHKCLPLLVYSFILFTFFLCNHNSLLVICEQTETVVIHVHVCSNLSALQSLDYVYNNN